MKISAQNDQDDVDVMVMMDKGAKAPTCSTDVRSRGEILKYDVNSKVI